MLADGKIDLLSDISYTQERTEQMLFSTLPMGSEEYYIFVAPGNTAITAGDFSSFNGKKIGVNKGSVQADFFREWAQAHGVQAELVEMTESVDEALTMLNRGVIDMYIALDAYLDTSVAVPVCEIGKSDYYFAVSASQPELLSELNAAMDRIQEEDRYFNQTLNSKYIKAAGINYYLSAEELAWLDGHGAIRVGYQDNYLAFCASDPKTGELTGALKDYLRIASDCLGNAHIDFEAVCYPTAAAALDAVKRGEVDCAFPANLTDYDGESQGFYMTPPLMRTDMSAVVRASEKETFAQKERVTVAVNAGNTNYDMFLLDHFPDWRSVYFKDTPEGLKAIADGKVDTLLISNFRYNNIASLCQKYNLVTLSTGVEMDYCFAVARGYFKEHLVVFDDKARAREAFEHRLEGDLRRAIDNHEFEVHYQPKYDIQANPPKLMSAEALVRWRHPELGMISPGDFIPLFERNGQIDLVDKYVWGEAARQIADWRRRYGVTIPVSVNLSRVDVFDPELEAPCSSSIFACITGTVLV